MISMISAWFQNNFRMVLNGCCELLRIMKKNGPPADPVVNNAPRYGMSEKVTPQPLPAQEKPLIVLAGAERGFQQGLVNVPWLGNIKDITKNSSHLVDH